MYCKFCGNRINSNTIKCTVCGADIDFTDGGQSFFDDNELAAWQSDNFAMKGPQTCMPKTEMRELPNSNISESGEINLRRPRHSADSKKSQSRVRKRKKKTVLDYLNISSSNRLIIFCIASALAIVLLVVAIIAVISGGNEQDEETATQNLEYSQQVGEKTSQNVDENGGTQPDNAENSDNENGDVETGGNDKTEIKDIKVLDENGKEVRHPVSGYIYNEQCLYLSVDRVLNHMGYKTGKSNGNNVNRIIYEHKTNGNVVEIEKGSAVMYISQNGGQIRTVDLEYSNFNVGSETYVPIKRFLSALGYDESKIVWDSESKTLYFSK